MSGTFRWQPLEHIIYGFAIHPLSQAVYSRPPTTQPGDGLVKQEAPSSVDHPSLEFIARLDVGDEIYAFEQCVDKHNVWYRGYVVSSTRSSFQQAQKDPSPSGGSIAQSLPNTSEEPEVAVAIFPRSHIHIRDELPDAEGRLAEFYARLTQGRDLYGRDRFAMETLREEDESTELEGHPRSSSAKARQPANGATPILTGPNNAPLDLSASPIEKPTPPRPSIKSGDDTASGQSQPLVDEIASALREWHSLLFVYLAKRDYKLFNTVKEHLEALHLGRRQLLSDTLSVDETSKLRRACVAHLVRGNVAQGLDIIVRHPTSGALVSFDLGDYIDDRSWMSAVRMYAMQVALAHMDELGSESTLIPRSCALYEREPSRPKANSPPDASRSSARSSRSLSRLTLAHTPSTSDRSSVKFYHVYLELRAFVASPCSPGETVEVYFSLYSKSGGRFLTEEFCAILNHNGVLARDSLAKIRTLFNDLGQQDVQDTIYLVCRIIRNGSMKLSSSGSRSSSTDFRAGSVDDVDSIATVKVQGGLDGTGSFRRPFGCAVMELQQLARLAAGQDETTAKEHTMPIFVPTNEASFSTLHQDLISSNTKEFEKSPRADMLAITVKVFHGDTQAIVKENPTLLQDTPITSRLGFPDVVFPGDARNEVYIKLWSGEFNNPAGGSSVRIRKSVASLAGSSINPSNVEVSCEVRRQSGQIVEGAIALGTGEPAITRFHSLVFHRNNAPTYGELIKITVPEKIMPECHLFFTFRNRSSKEKASMGSRLADLQASDRPFAFAYLPLFPEKQAFLADGSHTLVLYKADKLNTITVNEYYHAPAVHSPAEPLESFATSNSLTRNLAPLRDTFTIRSFLCSTQFTANGVLVDLLNWERLDDKNALLAALGKFTFVGEMEIVKFLRDIFDSLFAILVSPINQSGEMDDLVFNALVTVLAIVQDRRFNNFQPVLDIYIENHFNCAAASYHMLHSMNRLLADPAGRDTASPLRAAIKVWHYIFKFIIRARELQKTKEVGMGATTEHLDATFKREIMSHLGEVNKLMSKSTLSSVIGTQTLALQHFASILPELADLFSQVELVSMVTAFVNASPIAKGKIVIWKLLLCLQLARGFLFDSPQSRALLLESIVGWIKPHFGGYDEYMHVQPEDGEAVRDAARIQWLETSRICMSIIAVMVDRLLYCFIDSAITENRHALRQEQENVEYLLSLLPRMLDSYRELQSIPMLQALARHRSPATVGSAVPVVFPGVYPFPLTAIGTIPNSRTSTSTGYMSLSEKPQSFNVGLADAAMTILVLILAATTKNLVNFLESYIDIEGKENTARLLFNFFQVGSSILRNDAFPHTWLNVNILSHKVILKLYEPISLILLRDFIPNAEHSAAEDFDVQLWREGLSVLLQLLSSDQLVIEDFSPQKRRAVWRLAGDLRGDGAAILLRLWETIGWPETLSAQVGAVTRYGGYQIPLISLVEQVLNLCLSHHDQLRSNAVQILYSMIVSEYHQSGNFNQIETELVNKLDKLFMSDTRGDDISRAFFVSQLRHLFDSSTLDDQLKSHVGQFLDSVDLFLELLLSVRELPDGEEYQDDRVIATLRLMNFIRRIGRDEIYIKYVHQLVNMHLQSHNYVEAALTLKLHSDLHEWDLNAFVDPMPELDLPRQSQFVRKETLCLLILDYLGKGKAWESAIEICKELAEQHSEVTQRLAEILVHQANLLEHIVADQRYYSEYFRVAFYGNFPVAIRDKHFIYRGYEWEKLGAFCERMLNKHPGARLLKTAGEPSDEIRYSPFQYIQCISVTPEPDRSLAIFTNPDVPDAVRKYYEHSAINLFSSTRHITSNPMADVAEFEDTWVEKTFYTTEEMFPTVLRRSEIVEVHVVKISPIENAINDVETRTKELNMLEMKYTTLAQTESTIQTNPLAAALNDVVDMSDDSGVLLYRRIFLGQDYIAQNPDHVDAMHKLSIAIEDQVRVIGRCLTLHGALCPPEMRPAHGMLERFFRRNFADEIERLNMVDEPLDEAPSSPLPSRMPYMTPVYGYDIDQSTSPGSPSLSIGGHYQFNSVDHRVSLRPMIKEASAATEFAKKNQTPLQRNLAHLTRHGLNNALGVAGERSTIASETRSESPDAYSGQFVNVGYTNGRENTNGTTKGTGRISRKLGSIVRRQK